MALTRRPRPIDALLAMLAAGACAAACAGPAPPPATGGPAPGRAAAAPAACPAGAPTSGYDLWQPGDHCAELDQRWQALPARARACQHDRDCALVTGPCFVTALRHDAVADGYRESPCVHPAGGMCPPEEETRAACRGGCCVPVP